MKYRNGLNSHLVWIDEIPCAWDMGNRWNKSDINVDIHENEVSVARRWQLASQWGLLQISYGQVRLKGPIVRARILSGHAAAAERFQSRSSFQYPPPGQVLRMRRRAEAMGVTLGVLDSTPVESKQKNLLNWLPVVQTDLVGWKFRLRVPCQAWGKST